MQQSKRSRLIAACIVVSAGWFGFSHSSTVVLLLNADMALDRDVSAGDVLLMRRAIATGASVNHRGPAFGRTPLMVAAIHGQPGSARFLIQHGANPTLLDRKGQSALELATGENHPEVAAVLRAAVIEGQTR